MRGKLISIILVLSIVFSLSGVQTSIFAIEDTITVESIEITSNPTKTQYYENTNGNWSTYWNNETGQYEDYFNYNIQYNGLEMTIHYTDGSIAIYKFNQNYWSYNGGSVNFSNNQYNEPWGIGTHTITVSYMQKITTFDVEIVENPVESIEITSIPAKTQYTENSGGYWWNGADNKQYYYYNIQCSGLEMIVHYKDMTTAIYNYNQNGSNFNGESVSFDGNQLNKRWTIGTNTVTVSYMGKTTTFDVGVIESPVESIEIITLPQKTKYIYVVNYNYNLQYSGLEMKVNFKDETSAIYKYDQDWQIFNEVSFSGNQSSEPWGIGIHQITVSYMGKSTTFDVEVVENPVESIEVTSLPTKKQYVEKGSGYWSGQYQDIFIYSLQYSGIEMTVHYNDGTSDVYKYNQNWPYNEASFSDNQYNKPWGLGTHTVTVTYLNKTATFDVEVVESPVESIEITSLPTKTQYIENFSYNLQYSGLKMTIHYTDGSTAMYDYNRNWERFNGESVNFSNNQYNEPWGLGTHTIIVSYLGKTASFNVEVIENPIDHIEITSLPLKMQYIQNVDYSIEPKGFKMNIFYKDGSIKEYSYNKNGYLFNGEGISYDGFSPISPWVLGENKITVSYLGKTDSFTINVVETPVDHIEITKLPNKLEYIENSGEWLDPKGLEMKVYYKSGSIFDYSYDKDGYYINGYYISIHDGSIYNGEIGTYPITVEYMDTTAEFEAKVVESPVESIEIVSMPQVEYNVGQYPQLDGINLRVKYKDGSTEDVTLDNTVNTSYSSYVSFYINGYYGYAYFDDFAAKLGENTLTLEYLGAQTKTTVNVTKTLDIDHIEILKEPDSLNGIGAELKIYTTDGQSFTATIEQVCFGEGGSGTNGDGTGGGNAFGFALTSIGTYNFGYSYKCEGFNITEYSISFAPENDGDLLGNCTATIYNSKKLSVSFLADQTAFFIACCASLNKDIYNGKFTSENIDTLILLAYILSDYNNPEFYNEFYNGRISGALLIEYLKEVFVCENIDLALSEYYDAEDDVYIMPDWGYGGNELEKIKVSQLNNGDWFVQWSNDNMLQGASAIYLTITDDMKIKTITPFVSTPSLTVNPENKTVVEGKSTSISVTASTTDGGTLTYQWQVSTDNGVTFTDVTNANSDTLAVDNAALSANGIMYRCIVTNSLNGTDKSVTSEAATLTVKLLGDINNDGSVSIADAMLVFQFLSGTLDSLTDEQLNLADIDGNGTITISDAMRIFQYISGTIESLT